MKKFLIVLLVTVVLLGGAAYLASNFVLEALSKEAVNYLTRNGKNYGMDISQLSYGSVKLASYNAAVWKDFAASISFLKNGVPNPDRSYTAQMGQVRVDLGPSFKSVDLSGKGIHIAPAKISEETISGSTHDRSKDTLDGDSFKVTFDANVFDPAALIQQMPKVGKELVNMLKTGEGSLPAEFLGKSNFMIDQKLAEAKVRIEYKDGRYVLLMDKEDLKKISDTVLVEKLTKAEIEFLYERPIQTPQLLRVKERAKTTARAANQADANVPEDAYRHVLWSYLLTKEFDETMAEKMTTAHEYDEAGLNPDHQMDFDNNVIGRNYAKAGYEESSILQRVLTDPNVVKAAGAPVAVAAPVAPEPAQTEETPAGQEAPVASVSATVGAIVTGEAAAPVAATAEALPVSATVSPEVASAEAPAAPEAATAETPATDATQ